MKKILALALALIMVMSLATVAFAVDPSEYVYGDKTLTINKTTAGHVFNVYQIFTADIAAGEVEGSEVLSNVKYGVNYGTAGSAVPDTVIENISKMTPAQLATWLENVTLVGDPYVANVASSLGHTAIGNLVPGYYMIMEDTSATIGDGEAFSKYIVQIVNDTSVNVKSGVTSSEKKVMDNDDDGLVEGERTWIDSADYAIGAEVPFLLTAKVASDFYNYTHGYELIFHDQMEDTLEFQPNSVEVTFDVGGKTFPVDKSAYDVVTNTDDDCTFAVYFPDLTEIENMIAGAEIRVRFNAVLKENANIGSKGNYNKSKITYTNNPNVEQAGTNGETPWDEVKVFTYSLQVNKFEGSLTGKPLEGADFVLVRNSDKVEFVATKNDDGTIFTFSGIDAGVYTLKETVTPDGYNTIQDVTVQITATHDHNSPKPALTGLNVQLTAPDGYASGKAINDGVLGVDIVNKAGSSLPETGSIGTHIFYLFGTVLTLGAALMLITKKRMNNI